jgi:hypothetical protein
LQSGLSAPRDDAARELRNGAKSIFYQLASRDGAADFCGPNRELRAFRLGKPSGAWSHASLVFKNTIHHFPPVQLRTGEWGMAGRPFDFKKTGVYFPAGGVKKLDDGPSLPVWGTASGSKAEKPDGWILPDNLVAAAFRDRRTVPKVDVTKVESRVPFC